MTTRPNSPKLLKRGILRIDLATSQVQWSIALQRNTNTPSHRLQAQEVKG